MDLIADILLSAAALGAMVYCIVLARRLRRLTGLESGMAGAIAVFSAQVDDLTRALEEARDAARGSVDTLAERTARAEAAAARIDLLLASLHDLPEPPERPADPDNGSGSGRRTVLRRPRRPAGAVTHDEAV